MAEHSNGKENDQNLSSPRKSQMEDGWFSFSVFHALLWSLFLLTSFIPPRSASGGWTRGPFDF
jgi:hypothetical protein